MSERLYIVFGTGPDAVGLVGQITTPIAAVNGNIIDLRQDVLHGLFTVFLVVDFEGSESSVEEIQQLVTGIAERTGLDLRLDKYQPLARSTEKVNLLLILLGRDRPGIIATVSEILGSYQVNIDFSQMIARERIFLMELLVDIRRSVLPLANLETTLHEHMAELGIDTLFQSRDVFNKKKRILLFDLQGSFMSGATRREILRQAGVGGDALETVYPAGDPSGCLEAALSRLDGLPVAVLERLADACQVAPGTVELMQTLRTMGYQVAIRSYALGLFTDALRQRLGIEHCYGITTPVDEDTMTLTDDGAGEERGGLERTRVIAELAEREGAATQDITVIADAGCGESVPPGIHLIFDVRLFLDFLNQRILSPDSLIGVLGAFGAPVSR